ncbi:MAG: dephospho-CoA kinase [Nitrospirota bacterium]
MLVAGLTGNYGMGKSYVLSVFRHLGAVTIDCDRIVDILLNEKEVIESVNNLIGSNAVSKDNKVDKRKIAGIAFKNKKIREKLEKLLHPLVLSKIDNFIDKIKDSRHVLVVEIPLLFEGNYQDRFDKTITVYTTRQKAVERLKKEGVSENEALVRLRAQLPINVKKKLADYTIDNNRSKESTRKQVEKIYRNLIEEEAVIIRGQHLS